MNKNLLRNMDRFDRRDGKPRPGVQALEYQAAGIRQRDRARIASRRAARSAGIGTRSFGVGATRLGQHHAMSAALERKGQRRAHRAAACDQDVYGFSVHCKTGTCPLQSLPTSASIAAMLFGVSAVITSQPSALTSTSSSMRTPMFQ